MTTTWTPRDPDFHQRVTDSFDRQQVMKLLNARIRTLLPGQCCIEVPFRTDLGQQNGFFHAGITSTIADSAGGYAGYSLMPPNSNVLTVEFKVTLLRPAKGELLIANGEVIRAGKNLVFSEVEAYIQNRGQEPRLCARMTQTLATIIEE